MKATVKESDLDKADELMEDINEAMDQVNDGAPAAELLGQGIPKPPTPVREVPVAEDETARRMPYAVTLIDESVPIVRVSGRVLMAGSAEPVEGANVAAWTVPAGM